MRSLVTTEEFMTPWGRMNQDLGEADCCLLTSVSERGSEMQWCRAWGLDWSWNPDCSQVAGAHFFTLSFLFWKEDTSISFMEFFNELHEITYISPRCRDQSFTKTWLRRTNPAVLPLPLMTLCLWVLSCSPSFLGPPSTQGWNSTRAVHVGGWLIRELLPTFNSTFPVGLLHAHLLWGQPRASERAHLCLMSQ